MGKLVLLGWCEMCPYLAHKQPYFARKYRPRIFTHMTNLNAPE